MSMSDAEILCLHELLDGLVENNLSIQQKAELQSLLESSEDARKRYIRFMDMSASFKHYSEELVSDDFEIDVPEDNKPIRLFFFNRYSLFLAALAVAGFYLISSFQTSKVSLTSSDSSDFTSIQDPDSEPILDAVAVLTKLVGVEWAKNSGFRPDLGSTLEPCVLDLDKGLAQVEFLQGSSAILEAPIVFEISNPNEATLFKGKLRASVPRVARGYTVNLPHGQVIDLGTEFGLNVHSSGSAEIFVYQGKVLYSGLAGNDESISREISGGEALFIDSNGFPNWVEMPSEAFIGPADLAFQSKERSQQRHSDWTELSKEISQGSQTSFYYSFDNHSPWARVLKDQSTTNDEPVNGAIVGCKWSEGRWAGKGALSFKRENDRVRLDFRKKLSSATFSAWVKIDLLNSPLSPLLHSESRSNGAASWFINKLGQLVLEVKHSNKINRYASAVAFRKECLGRWIHLATSYDKSTKMISHYVNGRPFSREKINISSPLCFNRSSIGYFSKQSNSPKVSFNGSIDELALFKTSLPELEIRRIYELGSPYESHNIYGPKIP